ncbi:uncharacterized protein PGTG_03562 [Puccinia graminis f. sp. tritici CRL 75-36-700-3]|uniref:MIOS-like alpha-solenoid domain-containing protein n=1 Tax=Puccinia graminis f. sp. tritici (strain CRL 75-36-700-3 / race SCCL) TaxID=418459 RepID=E3JZY1_PUCGT|nr:uncharacterized protein PGTG_03562 [Puccinia graminis f. sp. tritici CRL 75-36-700-3]EFP77606.2 hypothetical protein PGTG_03562 [Puccinia graminis f. sp. tritici CRL 75-36-700-3]
MPQKNHHQHNNNNNNINNNNTNQHQQTTSNNNNNNNNNTNNNNNNCPSRRFTLLQDPSLNPTGKFLVVSNSELRSYQAWKVSEQQQINYRSISFRSDLPYSYKCVDWSTTRQGFDLVAAGTSTGRAFLVTLPYAHHPTSKPELYSPHPIISFSTGRSTRPCNSIAFSPCGKLLALALDKARDYGLQIYDLDRILGLSQAIASNNHEPIPPPIKNSLPPPSSPAPPSCITNQYSPELVISPHPTSSATDPHSDQLALAQAINAETVHAIEFILITPASNQPSLLAASSSKLMALYDLRSPGTKNTDHTLNPDFATGVLNPVSQWPARSILGIKADPLVAYRFATWGDDRCVKLWDSRKTSECVLQFSQDDPNPTSARGSRKTEGSIKGEHSNQILSVTWSKARKGLLATLSSDSSRVRIWDIVDGNPPVQSARNWGDGSLLNPFGTRTNLPPGSGSSSTSPASFPNVAANFRKSAIAPRGSSPSTSPREKVQLPNYTILSSRLLKPFSRPSQAIVAAHMPTLGGTTASNSSLEYCCNLLSISREGHLEFLESKSPGEASFGARGQTAYSDGVRLRIEWHPLNHTTNRPQPETQNTTSIPMSTESSNTITASIRSPPRLDLDPQQPLPLDLKTCSFQDIDNRCSINLPTAELNSGPLKNDISMVMMKRALSGYGPNPMKNEHLVPGDPVLGAFWEWITHSDKLSQQGTGLVNGYDFSFQGVLAIMKGFLPVDQQQQQQQQQSFGTDLGTPPSQRRGAQMTTPERFGVEFLRSPKPTNNNHPPPPQNPNYSKQVSQYLKALRTFNHSHQVENFTISSEFSDQRQTALFLCGPDYNSGKIEEVLTKYEQMGMYGKACAIALFSGNTQRAITSLQRSDDLQLRTLAPPLATHLNTQRHGQARDPIFDQVCRQLSDERTSEPYLRAIFAYCATGDWREVIDETGLPLKDRLAVGLRFLSDEEIFHWLEESARDAIQSGDLEGILLTGLNHAGLLKSKKTDEMLEGKVSKSRGSSDESRDLLGPGFRLIQTYVNRTGDLQTAALASHLVVPTRLREPTAERWVDSYRRLLDRWTLFNVRVELDISRGLKARQSLTTSLNSTGTTTTSSSSLFPSQAVNPNSLVIAPPQLLLRCQHCLEVLSDGPNVRAQLHRISERAPPVLIPPIVSSSSSSAAAAASVAASAFTSASASSASVSASASPVGFSNLPGNPAAIGPASSKKNMSSNNPLFVQSKQTNRCRMCGKGLPKCSICLIPLTINDSRTPSIWAWCHRCRHVGHAHHLDLWASRGNLVCPVSGCDCLCWDASGPASFPLPASSPSPSSASSPSSPSLK